MREGKCVDRERKPNKESKHKHQRRGGSVPRTPKTVREAQDIYKRE